MIVARALSPIRLVSKRSVRLRLTVLYGGLLLLAGAVLLTITYLLVANQGGTATFRTHRGVLQVSVGSGGPLVVPTGTQEFLDSSTLAPVPAPSAGALQSTFQKVINGEHSTELRDLLIWSGIALGIMALVSAVLGWLIAGRVLEPLRTMTARARRISGDNLHERLALDGPEDELKELGDTFDAVLGRLEGAFDAQRRFVANASHELRTPLTLERAMVEVALADPDADAESLRLTCQRVLAAGEQQERLIEGLLTLARSQRGLEENEPLDLEEVSGRVLEAFEATRNGDGCSVESELSSATISGDERLLERLVANLVDNAVRHNVAGGWVRVRSGVREGRPTLSVSNSGPIIAPGEVGALLEPFRRAGLTGPGTATGTDSDSRSWRRSPLPTERSCARGRGRRGEWTSRSASGRASPAPPPQNSALRPAGGGESIRLECEHTSLLDLSGYVRVRG